jgi:integration host factor subunit beta
MIKSELVARIAEENPNFAQADLQKIVDAMFQTISDALVSGERVEIRGFGAFSIKYKAPRTGRNPRTGEPVEIEQKYVPHFKTGKELRGRLNSAA